MNRCPACDANMDLVGRTHRCIPKSGGVVEGHKAGVVPVSPVHTIGSEDELRKRSNGSQAGIESSPPAIKRKRAPKGTFDKKTYMRDYMRNRRAKPA